MSGNPAGTEKRGASPRSRSIRFGGALAILFGFVGALSGLAGAGTFIPFRNSSTHASQSAGVLTVISIVGSVVSVIGVVAGWGILRSKVWAWNVVLGVAAASVTTVAVMTAVWPASWGFLVVVALAYALEVTFLLAGRTSYLRKLARSVAG